MPRLASWLLVGLGGAGTAFIVATSGALPSGVATHFGRGGAADGWKPRQGYTGLMVVLEVLLPLVALGALGHLPWRAERFLNLPHRHHGLAPERRAGTVASLRGFGAAIGIATALMLIGAHAAILDANAKSPPQLDETLFVARTCGIRGDPARDDDSDAPQFPAPAGPALMAERKSFLLRVDPDLGVAVERLAQAELRSVNAQVEYLLRDALGRRGALPGKPTTPRPLSSTERNS
jgi:hypothetical protein